MLESQVAVYLNGSKGFMEPPRRYGTWQGPDWLVAGDFDEDKDVDLLAVAYLMHAVTPLWNDGAGTFAAGMSFVSS